MEPESQNLLIEIAKMGSTIGILVWLIFYFKGELAIKNAEIKELNQALRDTQKDTIQSISKLSDIVQDLRDVIREKLK